MTHKNYGFNPLGYVIFGLVTIACLAAMNELWTDRHYIKASLVLGFMILSGIILIFVQSACFAVSEEAIRAIVRYPRRWTTTIFWQDIRRITHSYTVFTGHSVNVISSAKEVISINGMTAGYKELVRHILEHAPADAVIDPGVYWCAKLIKRDARTILTLILSLAFLVIGGLLIPLRYFFPEVPGTFHIMLVLASFGLAMWLRSRVDKLMGI